MSNVPQNQAALPDNFLTMTAEADPDAAAEINGRVFDSEMNRNFLQI